MDRQQHNARQEAFDELVEVMATLRSEKGCPWDQKQTHESLRKYLIEEAYEVLDAIDAGDMAGLKEELGDVLLQVVFHAQIASEKGRFTAEDVVRALTAKLIRRHPHVFGDARADDSDDVLDIWQAVKAEEKARRPQNEVRESLMDGIPGHYPALMYAAEVGKRAATVDFDWPDADSVWQKVLEEAGELQEVVIELDQVRASEGPDKEEAATARVEEEWGDLLFALVNYARHLEIDPEAAMRRAAKKFEKRFRFVEELAAEEGQPLKGLSPETFEALWDRAKERS